MLESKLNYPKINFSDDLRDYVASGEELIKKHNVINVSHLNIISLEREYKFWNEEVKEFLKKRFDSTYKNEYLESFINANTKNILSPLIKSLQGENTELPSFKLNIFQEKVRNEVDILIGVSRKLKFIPTTYDFSEEIKIPTNIPVMRKIFISHSSLDAKYVEKIIDVLEVIGVPSEKIFCSSFEGYGVKLGDNFLDYLKSELNNEILVLFILSNNFYSSAVSLCEMGATWVKTNEHIPILIPPFDYSDMKGVIPITQGMKIDDRNRYNSLKQNLENFFELSPINISIWERKRNNLLAEINISLK